MEVNMAGMLATIPQQASDLSREKQRSELITPALMRRSDALYSCAVARRLSRGVEVTNLLLPKWR